MRATRPAGNPETQETGQAIARRKKPNLAKPGKGNLPGKAWNGGEICRNQEIKNQSEIRGLQLTLL